MANNAQKQINEWLKSKGFVPTQGDKFPLFSARKTLYSQLGYPDNFIGSENQNASLLQGLQGAEKNVGVNMNANNARDIISAGKPQSFEEVMESTRLLQERIKTEGITGAGGQQLLAPTAQPEITPSLSQPAAQTAEVTDLTQPTGLAGTSAEGLLPEMPTADELASQALEQIQGSAAFPLQLEAQAASKEAVQLQAQRETEAFIKNIASRGLIFSGQKTEGVSQIETDKLSELLGIDRKFALLMVQGLETAAQGIAKEAQKGRQEAIDALETLGYAINPITNQIEPTFAARKAVATEERLATAEERQQQQFQLSVAQFESTADFKASAQSLNEAKYELDIAKTEVQLQQAQQKIDLAAQAYNLSLAKMGKPQSKIFVDNDGRVIEILSDPYTGEELARLDRGNIGKTGSLDPLDQFINSILEESLGELGES